MEAKKEGEEKVEEVMLPGFRFHPTDEELVGFYLKRKIQQRPLSIELIKHLDIYKYDPWDLPKFSSGGEKEWYFYCPRDRKYRNSTRPNRVTGAGFWKATGTDRPIYSSEGNKCIGLKKSLVFYKGRAAKGVKTDWMMHEFRLPSICDSISSKKSIDLTIIPASDSWAICRIFKKSSPITPRTVSNSWVSPDYNPCTPNTSPNFSVFSPQNTIKTSTTTFPMQSNSSTLHELNNILHSPINNFSFLDHIPSFKPIYPTTNDDNIESKPSFDQHFLSVPPMLDLPPSYFLPQLEDPCELSKSSIDNSSMLLNNVLPMQGCFSSKPSDGNINFGGVLPSVMLSQDDLQHINNVGDNHEFCHNLEDYQDFESALMGNLSNFLHGESDHYHMNGGTQMIGTFPISGLLPFALPETWKSSSTSLVWDCMPLS